ncbi:MAG: FAD-dependent oxidoreductase, partial [Planctomycetales bacterium]|nr:FAD-dependent oxidoreductase [Planctomycetales bacterium]
DYKTLQTKLLADGQVLEYVGPKGASAVRIDPASLPGVVLDDAHAKKTGDWRPSASTGNFLGSGYLHDNNEGKGEKEARFEIKIDKSGRYEIRIAYSANANRATNVPVVVEHAGKQQSATINQTQPPPIDGLFVAVGRITAAAGGAVAVTISNRQTDGHVIVDGVQLLPVE